LLFLFIAGVSTVSGYLDTIACGQGDSDIFVLNSGNYSITGSPGPGFSGVSYFYMGGYGIRPYKNTACGAPTIHNALENGM